jgi:hypothetical protein
MYVLRLKEQVCSPSGLQYYQKVRSNDAEKYGLILVINPHTHGSEHLVYLLDSLHCNYCIMEYNLNLGFLTGITPYTHW